MNDAGPIRRMPCEVARVIDDRVRSFIEDAVRFDDSLRELVRNAYFQGYRDAKQEKP